MQKKYLKKLAIALFHACDGKSKHEIEEITARVLALVKTKRLMKHMDFLFTELENVRREAEDVRFAQVTTKHALTREQQKLIHRYLHEKYKKDFEIEEVIDPALRGGFKIRSGDTIIDATLDHHIRQLAIHLTS